MSNKVIFISDLHWGIKNSNASFMKSMEDYFNHELIPYCLNNSIDEIYILGDFWDTREVINNRCANIVYEVLTKFQEHNINLIILIGNHDTTYKTNINVHSLKFFNQFDNIRVIDTVTEETIHGKNVVMYPWQVDDTFQEVDWKYKDICLGHFEINNCKLNENSIHEGGTSQSWFFKNFKQTFTGHFHTWSDNYYGDRLIAYCGSPYHLTRHDINSDRGFIVYDFDTSEWERVFSKNTIKFISVDYDNELKEEDVKNNYVDVNVKIDKDFKADDFNDYISKLEKLEPIEIKIVPEYDIIENNEYITEDEATSIKTIPNMITWKLSKLDFEDDFKKDVEEYMNSLMEKTSIL